jgi:antitoxin component of RelBE/YafQ-DinJ toxin-antitoxin module
MRKHYDFSKMKSRRNPYVKYLKQSVTIRLDRDTVEYFKALAVKTGLPYQNLINLYLRDCAMRRKELSMKWTLTGRRTTRSTKRSATRPAGER